jgi:SAM-dependent methyltransferase
MSAAADVRRLNWGCGSCIQPGWINSDIKPDPGVDLVGDIRDGLPIESDSLDYISSVHALPMISLPDIDAVLRELRRMLKPGGTLRLVLPDLEKGFAAYRRGDRDYFLVPDEDAEDIGTKFVTQILWYGYSTTFFVPGFVHEVLRKAGFREIHDVAMNQTMSAHPEIVELDQRENESLFVEAVK